MGVINTLTGVDDIPDYKPQVYDANPSQPWQQGVDAQNQRANRSSKEFAGDINQDVREKSNLMGGSSPNDPMQDALQARAKQSYESDLNRMTRGVEVAGVDRQNQLQSQDINNRAALYSNMASRAHLNWEQVSYQRQAAIAQELMKRQLYMDIFGGYAKSSGSMAALSHARNKSPIEGDSTMQTEDGGLVSKKAGLDTMTPGE